MFTVSDVHIFPINIYYSLSVLVVSLVVVVLGRLCVMFKYHVFTFKWRKCSVLNTATMYLSDDEYVL